MFNFTGAAGPQRKVDLRGKSRAEESREEVIEKARLQREKRQRAKLEQKSAVIIQCTWRQAHTARRYAAALRAEWVEEYGALLNETQGGRGLPERLTNEDARCISMLLRFFDPEQEIDRRVLALICTALTTSAAKGDSPLLSHASAAASSIQQLQSTATAGASPSEEQLALYKVSRLAALCLQTLSKRSSSNSLVFSSQFAALSTLQHPEASLVEFLIKIVNPDTFKPALTHAIQQQQQQQSTAHLAAAVLKHLYQQQLYHHLRRILQAIPAGCPAKSCGEVLVTQLTVRSITLQLVPTRTPPKAVRAALQVQSACTAAAASADVAAAAKASSATAESLQYGVCQLLFVPGLWSKCSSLSPIAGRLCNLALTELSQQHSSSELVAALTSTVAKTAGTVAGSAAAAAAAALAAVMDNLLEASAAGTLLKSAGASTASVDVTAAQAVTALVLMVDAEQQLQVQQKQSAQRQQQQQRKRTQAAAVDEQQRPKSAAAAAAFVPGAGFMSTAQDSESMAVDQQSAAAGDENEAMEVDISAAAAAEAHALSRSSNAAAASSSRALKQPVAASVYSAEQDAQQQQQQQGSSDSCFHLLAGTTKGTQLLRTLTAIIFPATTAAESATLQGRLSSSSKASSTAAAAAGVLPGGVEQQQLCGLLWRLSRPMQYRQRIWLGLSVGVRLVPRLWFSYILPVHASTPGGLLTLSSTAAGSSSSSSSNAGDGAAAAGGGSSSGAAWVQPLLVLTQAFSAALSYTHLEDFYAESAALIPLQQLYDSSNPSVGLLMLLKTAVWQMLWTEAGSTVTDPQQQQLKRALGESGGLLLCQLHDRNCNRQYCPPEAFLADLPAGRVLQEVAARGGVGGSLGFTNDSDDEDDGGATALEQQQQWQRQRQQQQGLGADHHDDHDRDHAAADEDHRGDQAAEQTGGVAMSPGSRVQATGAFGFSAGSVVQQRRQQAAATAAGSSGVGGSSIPNSSGARVWLVLQHAPCLIPFQERVMLFQSVVSSEKDAAAAAAEHHMFTFDDPLEFMMGSHENKFVTIRRDQLLDDSYRQLKLMDPDRLKGRLRIAYVNEAGAAEAGIDGGGLFKDFMEELLKQGFSPQAHLFAENPQHQLYPSPLAHQSVSDAEGQLHFLGRMLGKSLYEGILLELPLAAFFLKKMRGGVCDINDLASLDPEVYKNLLQLRHYKGDFAELSLSFTAAVIAPSAATVVSSSSSSTARQQEVELKPGGRNIPVRSDNVTEYIHRLADFRLNRQMDRAAAAFLRGFFELIKPRWVRMFNEAELQMLISGSEEGIDVDDLMKHVNYAGGYHEDHPVILTLWKAIRSFTPQQQRQFLKFVTSCSRAPLLGFKYLEPQLCVQMSGSVLAPDSRERLPTAATCMNLLKLPPYVGLDEMRSKLLYAITAGAGFELS